MIDISFIQQQLDMEHNICVEEDRSTPLSLDVAYKLLNELKASRKVVDAARELEEILSDVQGRAEIDSFTVQPLSLALKELDLCNNPEGGEK